MTGYTGPSLWEWIKLPFILLRNWLKEKLFNKETKK